MYGQLLFTPRVGRTDASVVSHDPCGSRLFFPGVFTPPFPYELMNP